MDVVLHVGAGQEQQLKLLLESDVGRVVLFEPHPEYAEKIRRTYPDSPNVRVVAAAVAAEEGSHSLQEFNFPEVNSLRYPKVVKQIFTGVVRRRSQVRTITPTQMVIEHGPGYQETACLVIEAPEEAYAILQPLIENGLLDRFVELQISMTVESCNTGNASAEKAIEALRDYGFEVVQHDAQDPDSPRWVLRRTPLKLEIKKIRQELSQAKKRSQDLEKQLKEKKLAFEKLEEKFKNTHTYFMNRKKQAIELEAERKRLNKENQTLRNSLGETRAALSEKLAEIEHLKKAWAVKESEADSQRFEIKKQSEAHDVDGENNAEQYPYPEIKPVDPALQKELGIEEGEKVIGTFSPYEGLDLLLEACFELVQKGEKLKLLLVGDSQPLTLKNKSAASAAHLADSGLKETPPWLIQVGRVPHAQVADYYALLDAVVIPRKPLAVCQLVPPMKAAEALAYGKRLVVSDVAPLAEYADKYDGVVSFEAGSAKSLATALQGSLKLPAPKPSTELLFSAHTEPMVQALKGEGSAEGQKAVVESGAKSAPITLTEAALGSRVPDSALKKALGIAENEKVIGVFKPDQNLDSLISACTKLVEGGEKVKVLLLEGNPGSSGRENERTKTTLEENPGWLFQVELPPGEEMAAYYSLLDMAVVLQGMGPDYSSSQAVELIVASHYNIHLLMPEHCIANVPDFLANVVPYREGSLAEAINNILPYSECGKYQDDRSDFYSFLDCFDSFGEPQEKERSNVVELLNRLADKDGDKISLEEEKKIREFVDKEQSSGRVSNALATSKLLYENTGSFYAFKSYVKSLFFAQKYDHVARLCEKRDNVGSELELVRKKSSSYLALFKLYYKYCQRVNGKAELSPSSKKSVYFLHSSLPYFSGGYATRAHGLASALVGKGLDVKAYTRPNFPYDVKKDVSERVGSVKIDDITYKKTACSSVRTRDEASYMLDCVEVFDEVIKRERPGYIHGRSTYQISLPALIAAKKNSLPFVYEVSGLWEIVHESRETAPQRKHETEKIRHLETMVAKKADLVFTLTGAMKDELIARGVDGTKITILPNCTNPDKFLPREKSQSLLSELGISKDTPVIGYIGSFQDYEGLDDLIVACEILSEKQPDLDYRLLLVGDGPYYKQICDQADRSSVRNKIIITGRVPHSLASEYYSVIDIAPFPRKSWPVCEMVSPMKPLEALAMEKTVLVSSVKALSEMVVDGETGVVFDKGSVPSLAQTLADLIVDPVKRVRLGKNARSWVIKNRTWRQISAIFELSVFS